MSKWNDHSGEVIFNSIDVLHKFSELLKSDIIQISEKERSVGLLKESLADNLVEFSINQFSKAKEAIELFINSLNQIEYNRKIMYHRNHQLSSMSFSSSIELGKNVMNLLKEREEAIKRYNSIKNKKDNDPKLAQTTASFQSINTQTIQSAGTYSNQLNRDLIVTLTSFAHSQMELHAKSIEIWSKLIENIDEINVDDDINKIMDSLKESSNSFAIVNNP